MTDNTDTPPRRKTLSVKRARPAPVASEPAPRETPPPPRGMAAPREAPPAEPRAGRLYPLDEHMRRMQADMNRLENKKD